MTQDKKKQPIQVIRPKQVLVTKAPRAELPAIVKAHLAARPKAAAKGPAKVKASLTARKLSDSEAEIVLFGAIGMDFFDEGITADGFNSVLNELGDVATLRLRINSGGGDVFDATAIYNMLVKNDAKVIVEIEGVAASAATIIAMAGDEIRMSENAHWMIHRASGPVWGNADDHRDYLKLLDNADKLIRLTYSARTGMTDAELVDLMSHDNWMTAQEALDYGFVDSLDDAKKVKPHVAPETAAAAASKVAALTPERLAAYGGYLKSLAASIRLGERSGSEGMDPNMPMIGDRVKVVGEPHMEGHIAASASKSTGTSPPPVSPPVSKEPKMNAKTRAACLKAGMAETLQGEKAETWLEDNYETVYPTAAVADPTKTAETKTVEKVHLSAEDIINLMDARDKRNAEKLAAWEKEVDVNVQLAFGDAAPKGLVQDCYALESKGIEAVRTKILEAKKAADAAIDDGGVTVTFAKEQPRDRHIAAIRAGVLHRALSTFAPAGDARRFKQGADGRWEAFDLTAQMVLDKHLPEKDRPKGWEDFAHLPLMKIAEESLYADGLSHEQVRRLSGPQIAMASLGFYRQAGIRAAAIHTTGSLAEVTRHAVNKSLHAGYEESPQTWKGPMRQGTSVSDFKDIHRVKLGAAPNLPVWPDNTAPEQAKLSNEKEKYAVEARAETLSFSWRLIINDDMDALSRRPQLLGDAAARTVNAVAWRQITSNPTMTDGQALFLATPTGNRKRKNLTTGAATPTNTTIGAMRALMRLMRGLNTPEQVESEDVLNIMPAFLVGPASLEELILKQVNSGADPASGGNSAVYNTARSLTPIIEPLLDASSTTAWYLFARPGRVDTVEVTFMQGFEMPQSHEWMDDETMCQNYSIIHVFEAKALDHRGLQKHDGA